MAQDITVKIVGKEFGLEVNSESEEESIRSAAARINDSIEQMKFDFKAVEESDLIRIYLLSEVRKLMELEASGNEEVSSMMQQIAALDRVLGEYLLSR